MKADLEITGGVLRIFLRNDAVFGDPFDALVALVGHEMEAILKGAVLEQDGPRFNAQMIQAVRTELRRHGFTSVRWTRKGEHGEKLPDFTMAI